MSLKRSSGTVPGLGSGDPDNWMSALFRRPSDETVHAVDDEFDNASKDAAWVESDPSGTTVWTEKRHVLSASFFGQGDADIATFMKPLALSAPVTIETAFRVFADDPNFATVGLLFADGTASTDDGVGVRFYTTNTAQSWINIRNGTLATFSSAPSGVSNVEISAGSFPFSHLYLRMIWSATNTWKTMYSIDGITWLNAVGTGTSTLTPTYMGMFVSAWTGSGKHAASFEYFRVTEADLSA